jgi:transposase
MNKTQAEERALFRYGLIAPVIHEQGRGQTTYFREVAKKEYQAPGKPGASVYSISTLKDWLRKYRRAGIDALYPSIRKDAGMSKKIDAEMAKTIASIFTEYPDISASALYRLLVKRGAITKEIFTEVTLRNYIRKNNLRALSKATEIRKKFEMPASNMLWTMDFLHGLYVPDRWAHNRKRKTYLCAIIDDHSRLLVGAQFAFAENSIALATTLKAAVLQYGIPQKIYCDNGSAFSTHTLQLACARIGMALIHLISKTFPLRKIAPRILFLNPPFLRKGSIVWIISERIAASFC